MQTMNYRAFPVIASLTVSLLMAAGMTGCGKKKDAEGAAKAAGEAAKAAGEAAKAAGEAAKGAGAAATAAAGAAAEGAGAAAPGEATEAGAAATGGPQRVFFVTPKDGATISGPKDAEGKVRIALKFGVEGMTVKPAGTNEPATGHHHIVIDGAPIPDGMPVPADEMHIHYGKGQTEAAITLAPGKHKLTMQFANYAHLSYGPKMASTIEITVNEDQPSPATDDPTKGPAGDPPTGAAADKAAAAAAAAAGTPIPPDQAPAGSAAAAGAAAAAKAAEAAAKAAEAVKKVQGQ